MDEDLRCCSRCGVSKPVSEYYTFKRPYRNNDKIYLTSRCKNCVIDAFKERDRKKRAGRLLGENKECGAYLGIYVAERILSKFFDGLQRAKSGNPGFDFTCKKGFKIDAKSSCLRSSGGWTFNIRRNKVADYFLCLAFDTRESLEPQHIWLIPGDVINNKLSLWIQETHVNDWVEFEKPLNKIISCCDTFRKQERSKTNGAEANQKDSLP